MNLVGYTDRLSAAPGDTVRFMVSSEHPRFRADLVRLIHGDESPAGPGYKEREVPSAINGEYPGRSKPIHSGSYVHVPSHPELEALSSFTVTAWVFPTTPTAGLQGLVSRWTDDPAPQGFALVIGPNGDLGLHLADGQHPPVQTATGAPLHERVWTFVGASYDAASGRVVLIQQPLRRWPVATDRALITHDTTAVNVTAPPGSPLLFAALSAGPPERTGPIAAPYNGKLDGPRLYDRALSADELTALATPAAEQTADGLLATWDFSLDITGYRVTDAGPHQLHGQTVNMPARGVTGHNFTGAQTNFNLAPHEYGAIHFHDDDVEDVAWESDFRFTIPSDLPSGVYAARLRAGDDEDYLPFCVRPARGTATSRIAVLMPTLTYVVYANFRDIDGGFWDKERVPNADPDLHEPEFAFIRANGLPGLYERHSDGSGTTHVSQLRPILNMRPKFRYRVWAAPARFPADLYLIDWLEATGHQVDVITDHDLHAEGADLLAPYRVVLTGSHHEYWTTDMLAGMRSYLDRGGRLMYLGGNGFFGVTTIDAERPTSPKSAAGAPAGPSKCLPPNACTAQPASRAEPGATAACRRMAWSASARAQPASTGAPTTSANPTASIPAPPSYLTASATTKPLATAPHSSSATARRATRWTVSTTAWAPRPTPCSWPRPSATPSATRPSSTNVWSTPRARTACRPTPRPRVTARTCSSGPTWSISRPPTAAPSSPSAPSPGAAASPTTTTTTPSPESPPTSSAASPPTDD